MSNVLLFEFWPLDGHVLAHSRAFLRYLYAKGHKFTFLHGSPDAQSENQLRLNPDVQILSLQSWRIPSLILSRFRLQNPKMFLGLSLIVAPFKLYHLIKLANQGKAGLVHILTADEMVLPLFVVMLFTTIFRKPKWRLLITIHYAGLFDSSTERNWLRKTYKALNCLALRCMNRAGMIATIFVYSECGARILARLGLQSTEVPWPIEVEKFQRESQEAARRRLGLPVSTPLLLFFGIMRPEKGIDVLLEAIRRVSLPFKLVIAGLPGKGVPLQKWIDGLEDRIILRMGYINEEDVTDYYNAVDCLLVPYRFDYYNAKGITSGVAAQSICSGKVVIITEGSKFSDLVMKCRLGLVVPPASPVALAGAITSVLENLLEMKKVALKNVEPCRRHFSGENVGRMVYRDISTTKVESLDG